MDLSGIPIYSSFIYGLLIAISPVVVPWLLCGILKFILHRLYSFVYVGLSKRETKQAYRKIDNTVDGVSNISDLVSSLKSDKGK